MLRENIASFSAIKADFCEFGINVVVSKDNYNEVLEIAKLMKSLGVNHVKFAPLITNHTQDYHKDFKDEVSKNLEIAQAELNDTHFKIIDLYTGDFENSVIFQRQYRECPIKEFICVIGANQKVYFCHDKAYLSNGAVGSIKDKKFKDLWLSENTTELFRNFNAFERCGQHCVYDSRNEIINAFLNMDMSSANFI